MNKTTTIVNHLNTDRVIEITISNHKYIVFTIMYRNLVVIDATNSKDAVLLLNKNCASRDALSNEIDKVILAASRATDNEDFESSMGTYIHLNDVGNNDTTAEISNVYKIITEDYNL